MRDHGCRRILVAPLYPQYAASTTASVIDEVARCLLRWRNLPEIRYVRSFHDQPGYIAALAQSVRDHWMKHGEADKLVMSFHGVPKRSLDLGDPYHCECHATAHLLATKLGLPPERWQLTFQSRFGKAQWLEPYTQPTLEALARQGTQLEEIAVECRQAFIDAGGKTFHYIPCLNERHDWITALTDIVVAQLCGWPDCAADDSGQLAASARRAHAAGAEH